MAFGRPKKTRAPSTEAELFDYAVKSLGARMQSVRDLKRKLKDRAEPGTEGDEAIARVIAKLEEMRYLSDERYAADFAKLRQENRSLGRRRVQQDLQNKGIHSEVIATTLNVAYEDVDEVALARAYVERKRIKQPVEQKEVVRVMNRLIRAGYSSNAIFKLFRSWKVEVPVEGDSDQYGELPEF